MLLLLLYSDFGNCFRRRFHRLIGLQFLQIVVEAIEVIVPEAAKVSQPTIDLLEGDRSDTARAPLRLAPARDQAGML
jgi:hypothetical protein